ncbi:MAG TPA: hypothetical protein DDZ96_01175 [Porphyromonadaceae bacterium]|jgi:hypothetical protein|uniref:hypothetical protein n=1 Tax=Limibacterium fermenti TaxID=3229863 RepID=UPI000E9EC753|nr:hypothetical protein [Porphyromonadaceae bacterium]HBK32609.1 hypothetical protein [Porphyromonadaceae bacterium]HBL32416.1 hypothetical protein [Porphyromonadaceae bacterium]HBX19130.1 hypothetical protein [Porphyromonadaceae bacterium]HBX46789.1 hypothetical protein [Porphyromonadaceae bacterium]
MKVVILPEVVDYLLELSNVLYDKEYFGFEEAAIKYTDELFEAIKNELPYQTAKIAPDYFNKFGEGMYYVLFKRNKNTAWYAFFNIFRHNGEIVYFVRYINNNHMIAQYL